MQTVDAVILGAGAAGLFAAGEAAARGRSVVVLDHARRVGEKIRISGGGRCNFTNLSTAPERFLSANPRFALSALRRFTPRDFLARVEGAGISWTEKAAGQLFCEGKASQIVQMLVGGAEAGGAQIHTEVSVEEVTREGELFRIATSDGVLFARRLVVATGGKSIPKIGATGFGYRLAEEFGIPVLETRPGLVPLTFAEQELGRMVPLAGVAVPARVAPTKGPGFDEPVLFTHRGLSGPAILQVSSYWREGEAITADLDPGRSLAAALKAARQEAGKGQIGKALARHMPERVAGLVLDLAGVDPVARLADQGNAVLDRIAAAARMELRPVGTEGYRTAEVTLGGVDTAALDGRSMEAKAVPGLHFIGEVVDVTGWLGGYNFQWAWSSAWACAQAL
ncbi:aminoacetone oxidase family FAD-binding enzyme [Frigidibacter sp. MR17.14]|uniref:NAD(P)/FAD-dependent oxidoreductase n=1 Tax=Frigidibacter sp. MR17.14 TaxID=3126509 RepID=UPI003012D8A2